MKLFIDHVIFFLGLILILYLAYGLIQVMTGVVK